MSVNEPTENESIKRTKRNELECIAYVWAFWYFRLHFNSAHN